MQFLTELWIPILSGGIAVFIMSALVWTAFPHHKTEYAGLSNEPDVAATIRVGAPSPGLYSIPFMRDMQEMGTPEGKAKMERGPIAFITIAPNGVQSMGPMMLKSVIYNLIVSVFVAYVAWHTVTPDADYLAVFRIVGTVTFMTYALGSVPECIWFARPWKSYGLQVFDSLLYAGLMAGIFGWLWN